MKNLILGLLLATAAHAQQNPLPMGMLSSRAALAIRSDVSGELQLNDAQVAKIHEGIDKIGSVSITFDGGGTVPILDKLDENIKPVLTDDQWKRLTQLWVQFEGPFVLQSGAVVLELGLNEDTQKKVALIVRDYRAFWNREMPKVRKTSDLDHIKREGQKTGRKLLGLLTSEQRKKFSEMEGPKFRFQT